MAPINRTSKSKKKVSVQSASTIIRSRCKKKSSSSSTVVSTLSSSPAVSVGVASIPLRQDASNQSNPTDVDFTSAAAVSNLITTTNVFIGDSDERIAALQLNTKSYISSVSNCIDHFFSILSKHPTLHHLAEKKQDPKCSEGTLEYQLIILTRGDKTKDKYIILNSSLLYVGMNMKLQKYQHIDLTER